MKQAAQAAWRPVESAPASVAAEIHRHGRHLRFATLKEVLAVFLNADLEILEDSSTQTRNLHAVGTDHFQGVDESTRQREFVPHAPIARWLTVEAPAKGSALAYRDSHRLRVALAAS